MIHNPEVGSSSLPRATKAIFHTEGGLSFGVMLGCFMGAIVLIMSCGGPQRPASDLSDIRSAMAAQEHAWDRGDIPGFMEAYSDTICFISSRGTRCGRSEVQASYARNYPDQAAMGDLNFVIHEVIPVGPDHAWCTGEWSLYRTADTLGGGFSLLWTLETQGWRITRDHTY